MNSSDQTSLLHLMETGLVSETKMNKTRQTKLTSSVFATANSHGNIIAPLLSRFFVLEIPEYTYEEFRQISVIRLGKENVCEIVATIIAEKVWNDLNSKDVRDVIKIGRLANTIDEVGFTVNMMRRYYKKT